MSIFDSDMLNTDVAIWNIYIYIYIGMSWNVPIWQWTKLHNAMYLQRNVFAKTHCQLDQTKLGSHTKVAQNPNADQPALEHIVLDQ